MYLVLTSEQIMNPSRFAALAFTVTFVFLKFFQVLPYLPSSINLDTVLLSFFFPTIQAAMKQFTGKIVGMMKGENLYESEGGPIILSQV